ncbi:splicing factor, partial [Coemansia sp. RSA 1285]
MAEEIDVDALLDAPFKQAKVVTEQKSSIPDSAAKSRLETANVATPSESGPVEAQGAIAATHKEHRERGSTRKSRRSDSPLRSPARDQSVRRHRRERDDYDDDARYRRYSRSPARDYDRDDYYRDRSRSGYSRRHRSSRRESPRERSYAASRSRSGGRRRGGARSPSPLVDESERDLRTVFAMQLSARLRRSDLVDFFGKVGRVRDAHIVSDRGSRRSRGVAYVEFYSVDSAANAVSLSGERLLGVPIIVQPSEAQKNRQSTVKQYSAEGVQLGGSASVAGLPDAGNRLVCVKRLLVDIEPRDLQCFFDLFGPVESCRLEPDLSALDAEESPEWMAFVRFERAADAHRAASRLHGLELFGTRLRVRLARDTELEREDRRASEQQQQQQQNQKNSNSPPPATATSVAAEDDLKASQEGAGKDATAEQTLDSNAHAMPTETTADSNSVSAKHVLLLQNMVSPEEETEPDWVHALEEDVKGECSKFGTISEVHVDRETMRDIY